MRATVSASLNRAPVSAPCSSGRTILPQARGSSGWHQQRTAQARDLSQTTSLAEGSGRANSQTLYALALDFARREQFDEARTVFHELLSADPHMCKAYVSWAQMEKRCASGAADRFEYCRRVLQRGLAINPHSSCLVQAWGLMELQRGNMWAALVLLERCVNMDPARCAPVLRWHQVDTARKTVGSRSHSSGGSARGSVRAAAFPQQQQQQQALP